jgi:hypothetical protein
MKHTFLALFCMLLLNNLVYSQVSFKKVQGNKANYSLTIPPDYFSREAIGANVDLKYADSEGASIVTVVKSLPSGVRESDIEQMALLSNQEVVDQLESMGMQNITIIKRGFIVINGVRSYFSYYRDIDLYYHTITQFRKGKIITLTCTCDNNRRSSYMPYIFRVVNSLKS